MTLDGRTPRECPAREQRAGYESGMTTAELLGNAALGVAALVAIWALLQTLGVNVVEWIQGQLGV